MLRAKQRIAALEAEVVQLREAAANHATTEAVDVAHTAAQTAHSVALDARDMARDLAARVTGVQEAVTGILSTAQEAAAKPAEPDTTDPVTPATPIKARARKTS